MTYRYRLTIVFVLGFFIDCINIFMSTISFPSIASEFGVSESSVSWVANSYILGLTLIIPVSSWLSSKLGARIVMTTSMVVFTIGAIICGYSESFMVLIVSRFLQGLGGGLLIPVGQALVFEQFKSNERAKISTIVMVVALIAPAVSPGIGGVIVDTYSWQGVFISNVPFSLLTAFLALVWVKEKKTKAVDPDIKGILLISSALTLVLIGLSTIGISSYWTLPYLGITFGIVLSLFYVKHARRHKDPTVDLRVLKNTNLVNSIIVYFSVPGVFTGVNILSVFFLQNNLHWSAVKTGSLMVLYALGAFISMTTCGKLYNKVGSRRLFTFGLTIHSLGIFILSFVHNQSDNYILILSYFLMGIGGGVSANTAQITSMLDFSGTGLTRASAVWNLNRQVCFSVGTVMLTSIYEIIKRNNEISSPYHVTFLLASLISILPIIKIMLEPKKVVKYEN